MAYFNRRCWVPLFGSVLLLSALALYGCQPSRMTLRLVWHPTSQPSVGAQTDQLTPSLISIIQDGINYAFNRFLVNPFKSLLGIGKPKDTGPSSYVPGLLPEPDSFGTGPLRREPNLAVWQA